MKAFASVHQRDLEASLLEVELLDFVIVRRVQMIPLEGQYRSEPVNCTRKYDTSYQSWTTPTGESGLNRIV